MRLPIGEPRTPVVSMRPHAQRAQLGGLTRRSGVCHLRDVHNVQPTAAPLAQCSLVLTGRHLLGSNPSPVERIDIQRDRIAVFNVQEFVARPRLQRFIRIQAIGALNVCDGFARNKIKIKMILKAIPHNMRSSCI